MVKTKKKTGQPGAARAPRRPNPLKETLIKMKDRLMGYPQPARSMDHAAARLPEKKEGKKNKTKAANPTAAAAAASLNPNAAANLNPIAAAAAASLNPNAAAVAPAFPAASPGLLKRLKHHISSCVIL